MANDGMPPTTSHPGGITRNSPTTPVRVRQQTETMQQIAKMRTAGATFREIGETLGIDPTWARTLLMRALAAAPYEAADLMRTQEGERLDRLQRAYWPAALNGDHKAALVCLRIIDRRARLFGLDAPTQITVTSDVDAQITALAATIGLTAADETA